MRPEQRLNAILSSAGRRVGLLECLWQAQRVLGVRGAVVAVDAGLSAPAAQLADGFRRVPRCDHPDFLPSVAAVAREESARLIVPTIDPELPIYARGAAALGDAMVAVSSPETIAVTQDKRITQQWLGENGFPGVRQTTPTLALADRGAWRGPLILKPARGSASVGVRRIETESDWRWIEQAPVDSVVEELAPGDEYTVHVYVDRRGRAMAAVPCKRLEVRSGEVSKGLTVRHERWMEIACAVAEKLPGAWGPLNVQGFLDADDVIRITEINPRFGGGYPLADRAGAPFCRWLIEETLGRELGRPVDDWQDDLAMLRYDAAAFTPGRSLREERFAAR